MSQSHTGDDKQIKSLHFTEKNTNIQEWYTML